MKRILSLGFAAVMLFLFGCKTQIVTVDVVPADARVIANGVEYNNKSPIFIETSTGKQLVITAYKEGYRDRIYAVDYQISSVGKIYAWTSILILPAFGLLADNSWELKENNIFITLEPVSPEAKKEASRDSHRIAPALQTPNVPAANPQDVDQTTDPNAKKIFDQIK